MKKIAVIPIDNRPICYGLLNDILAQDNDIKLYLPKREYLGGLTFGANIEKLYDFLVELPPVDIMVVCLDTIAYGGLIPSRREVISFEEIKKRILKFKEIMKQKCGKILAFSSIMRISNNNINEEEKEYWSLYGKKIFEYSYNLDKSEKEGKNPPIPDIPPEILDDYLKTRKRNFEINKLYLDWLEDKTLDTLVFSKDDTGSYGLNLKEARELFELSSKRGLCAIVKTGADEIPLTLLARALCENKNLKIKPFYSYPNSVDRISKYEDISVKNCVEGQLSLANCEISNNFDLAFFINNFEIEQGDLVLGDIINENEKMPELPATPYFIADINNANGADNKFIKNLIKEGLKAGLYSYCGYNTSANSIGCAILEAVVKYFAIKNKTYNEDAFKKLLFTRLQDDWAYQANVRKYIRNSAPNFDKALFEKEKELLEFEKIIAKFIDFKYNEVKYNLPWKRSFEIEITVL